MSRTNQKNEEGKEEMRARFGFGTFLVGFVWGFSKLVTFGLGEDCTLCTDCLSGFDG